MFRRLFWLMVGAGFGFGVAFWLMRFVRETVERYSPEQVSANLSEALRAFGADLKEAVGEGRRAMAQREEELLAQLGPAAARSTDGSRRTPRP